MTPNIPNAIRAIGNENIVLLIDKFSFIKKIADPSINPNISLNVGLKFLKSSDQYIIVRRGTIIMENTKNCSKPKKNVIATKKNGTNKPKPVGI